MYLRFYCLLAFLCMFMSIPSIIDAHKILVIVPMNGKSHWDYMKVFINELLNRGNEVTCITTISIGDHKPTNYTEILIDPPFHKENLGNCFIQFHICVTNLWIKFEKIDLFFAFYSERRRFIQMVIKITICHVYN